MALSNADRVSDLCARDVKFLSLTSEWCTFSGGSAEKVSKTR